MNLKAFKIFCVIPAFNEEKTIVKVINDVKLFVDKVVVVDDCSGDDTLALLNNNFSSDSRVIILHHLVNRGQGAALETGTEYALKRGADIIVHFDADGQFVAREINDMVKLIKEGRADAVFGSRFLGKKSYLPFSKKYIIMPLARLINKILLGVDLTDPQNGFRALSREVAANLKIEQRGMAHCSEILHKVKSGGFRAEEAPVTVIYNNFGQRFSGGLKIIKELFLGALIK